MFNFEPSLYPQTPGVYLMKSGKGRIIYVGKAKNLRARLSSYFRSGADLTTKTRALVERVESLDILLTATEKEALLLECSLIKKHRPRYNVVLRDDKQYLLFKLDKSSAYPRLTITRKVARDGSAYFGPFTSATAARKTYREIARLFPIRKCRDTVFKNRSRPCLYHQIGQCLAPCVLPVGRKEYAKLVERVEAFLSGECEDVIRWVRREMFEASENLEFERAAGLRDLASALARTVEGQAAVLPGEGDLDALNLAHSEYGLGLAVLFLRQGRILDMNSFFWPELGPDEAKEALASFLTQFYRAEGYVPPRLLLPFAPPGAEAEEDGLAVLAEILSERRGAPVKLSLAEKPAELKLLDIAAANAKRAASQAGRGGWEELCQSLQAKLRLARLPERIEAVDVSHLGGSGVRVGQVVFEQGRPLRSAYRTYGVPQAEGSSDDYLALSEWMRLRIASGPPWPDLVLVDGGKGQLAAVERSMRECGEHFELASIAKGGEEGEKTGDRIFRPGRKNHLNLAQGGAELLFLQRMRDNVHRFVLSRQKRVRKKSALDSALIALPGIGPKTARLLWDRFGSLAAMRKASLDELSSLPGLGLAKAGKLKESLEKI